MATAKADTIALFDRTIIVRAVGDSFAKLNPMQLMRNPVIFVTEIVALLTTFIGIEALIRGTPATFALAVAVWLWLTVLFATFAEAVAEGRGRARAESLRRARTDTMAKKLSNAKERKLYKEIPAQSLRAGDLVLVELNDLIPSDGEIVDGVASVNESAITGESAPVIREAGGDRSAVTGGTQVVSDWLVIRITADPGNTFIDRMIKLVEGAERRKTPNEIALDILLAGLTLIFLLAVATLPAWASYSNTTLSIPVLAALLVTLIPTTIGGLLSAIGIAGMDRLIRFNVVATSGRAVEAAGDVDALLLDKTGTITFGNRMAASFTPVPGVTEAGARGRRHLRLARRRYPRRPLDPHAGPRPPQPGARASQRRRGCPVLRQHPPVRSRRRRPCLAQGCGRAGARTDRRERRTRFVHPGRGPHRPRRRHTARGQPRRPPARRDRAPRHGEARHPRALRGAAYHGHPHRDGDRRQPHHRGRDRQRSRRRTISSPKPPRRTSSTTSVPRRPKAAWSPCAATAPTTRRPWRRPMSASRCRPAPRRRAKPATWSISTATPPSSSRSSRSASSC